MPTWPTTPIPYDIKSEPLRDYSILTDFESGYQSVRPRWHRPIREFIITYRGIQSGNVPTQQIADFTIIRDFIVARRFQTETFTFGHPYYPNSVYVCRYGADVMPQQRQVRTADNNGSDIWELVVPIQEVF